MPKLVAAHGYMFDADLREDAVFQGQEPRTSVLLQLSRPFPLKMKAAC